ncbi:serine hydrolase [Streptomyces sp. UH6]|uniref:serine hydrolase domain-containing protein n=1 Tax=Streptomyces sp. UH6 TaxID=2748379 RepID=UPI0015D52360|nr:serine hydrolase domain-containing protein [Streptomyces sp. UH6]NYV76525.1 beta-lactamase family protein [Streptomyces sp. UH6]
MTATARTVLRQEIDPDEAGLDPRRLEELDRLLARHVETGSLPGYLLSVARAGRVARLTVCGSRDLAAGLPVEPDTLWRIYSMTKPVTSVAAMVLVEQGLLSLDDPLERHLPAFAAPRVHVAGEGPGMRTRPADGPVLIRHLLSHTAGLTFAFHHAHPVDALYREAGLHASVLPGGDLAETCDAYARLPLQFEPGSGWNYSVATNVLGRVIEVVSGLPLDVFVTERVLRPLRMHDSGFRIDGEQAGRLAELYGDGDDGLLEVLPGTPVRERPRFVSGSGGLVASAGDYHRFMEMLRRRGELDGVRLLRPATVELMTRSHLPDGADIRSFGAPVHDEPANAGVGFGLGFSVVVDPSRAQSPSSRGTFGWKGVATTLFEVDPVHDLTVQFMTQVRPRRSRMLFPEIRRLVHASVVD